MRGLAIALATLAAGLLFAACGGGGNAALIPQSYANTLQTDLIGVQEALLTQGCDQTTQAVDALQTDLQTLPSSVDASLRANLQQGVSAVRAASQKQCQRNQTGPTGPTDTGPTGPTSTGPTGPTSSSSTSSTTSTTSSTASSTATTTASSTASSTATSTAGSTTPGSISGGTPVGGGTTTTSSSTPAGGLGGSGSGGAGAGGY